MFLTQLRKLSQGNEFLEKSKDSTQRFKLTTLFKERLRKLVNSGKDMFLAQELAMANKAVSAKRLVTKVTKDSRKFHDFKIRALGAKSKKSFKTFFEKGTKAILAVNIASK